MPFLDKMLFAVAFSDMFHRMYVCIRRSQIVINFLKFLFLVLAVSCFHWGVAYVHNRFCVDFSLFGFVQHFFTMSSPFCLFLNNLQYELARHYVTIWLAAGAAYIGFVTGQLVM